MDQSSVLNDMYKKSEELNSTLISYWKEYSYIDSWQFWVVLGFLVIPLIILYFTIDRTKIFEILFFGFSVHMLWSYTDIVLGKTNLFVHLYYIVPLLPFALSISSSLLPIGFMLAYQYCLNHNKNFYLYAVLLSAIFSFGFGTIENLIGLTDFNDGMNVFYVFLIDLGVVFISYWLTKFVKRLRKPK
ncbi:hypothetical protein [Oceanobacillus sp. FSL H7-0719]|uniref:hypothetical protein n=1 Tax=Oceanobacillus sp. FSL H7-0719 TaxID=2954507 RepID=UPI003244DB47